MGAVQSSTNQIDKYRQYRQFIDKVKINHWLPILMQMNIIAPITPKQNIDNSNSKNNDWLILEW